MIKFKLNGQTVEVEEGTTILQAAKGLGIDIPTLCYHPALEPYQVCRICLVELIRDGKSQLVPSCGYKVEEGTEVHTNSEEVIEERKIIIELILAQAPNSEKVIEIAKKLGPDYSIEITEAHHKAKKDAPSGTAKKIAQVLADATGKEITTHAIRLGDIVGDHTIIFCGNSERIEITHRAHSRDLFALGALKAAKWIVGKPAGLYSMQNALQ